MSKRHPQWEAHARERDAAKDLAFLASLPTLSDEELAKLKRHYKKTPWRVMAIDRELNRRSGNCHADCGEQLRALASEARRRFDALSPEQQAAHRRDQAIDWAWGEMLLKYDGAPPITRERIAEIYDQTR